jgi:hypothetical protein
MAAQGDEQIGYQALPSGVPVHAADGTHVGVVHRVLDNAREHIFDGILIDTDAGRRFVDAPEVARITRSRVTLTIGPDEAAELPRESGRQTASGGRTSRGWRRWFSGQ